MVTAKSEHRTFSRYIFLFALLALAFSFGTFVGKAFTENQIRIAESTDYKKVPREPIFIKEEPTKEKADEKSLFGAADKVTRTFYDDPVITDRKVAAIEDTSDDLGEPENLPDPEPLKQKHRGHALKSKGKYTVQLLSSQTETEALTFLKSLEIKGLDGVLTKKRVPGMGVRYRISSGSFDNYASAQTYMHRLIEQKISTDALIQKNN